MEQTAKSWNIITRIVGLERMKTEAKPGFWKNYLTALGIFIHPAGIINLLAGTFLLLLFFRMVEIILLFFRNLMADSGTLKRGYNEIKIVLSIVAIPVISVVIFYDIKGVTEPILFPVLVVLAGLVALGAILYLKHRKTLSFLAEACSWSLFVGAWMSFPLWPGDSISLAYLCAGVSLPACFSLVIAATVFANPAFRAHWNGASKDAEYFFCPSCMARFVTGAKIPWLVRTSGRVLAREKPYLHDDFRDYFVCRQCKNNERMENIHTAIAVIDRPWETPTRRDGDSLHANIVIDASSDIRTVDADRLIIKNTPDLDYDSIIDTFHLMLKKRGKKGLKTPISKILVILVDDPPLSKKSRRRLSRWFRDARTEEVTWLE